MNSDDVKLTDKEGFELLDSDIAMDYLSNNEIISIIQKNTE